MSCCCSGININGAHAVARYLCRLVPKGTTFLYGTTNLEKAEVDHWLEYSLTTLTQRQGVAPTEALEYLDSILAPRVYLVGYDMTLADLAVYSSVRGQFCSYHLELSVYIPSLVGLSDLSLYPNVMRWFNYIASKPEVAFVTSKMLTEEEVSANERDLCVEGKKKYFLRPILLRQHRLRVNMWNFLEQRWGRS